MEKQKRTKLSVVTSILLVILTIYFLSLLISLSWSVLTSLKADSDYISNTMGWPKKFVFENYGVVWKTMFVEVNYERIYIEQMLVYSLVYAIGGAFLATFTPCIVAYACAKFPNFRLSKILVGFVVIIMAIPIVGGIPSELKLMRTLHLYDKLYGSLVLKTSFTGMYFLVFLATFSAIPKDYADAAYIDGAGNFKVLFSLILPIVSKTFLTIMLIKFIELWNDYSLPLLYMPSYPTLAYGLFEFSRTNAIRDGYDISSKPIKLAGCMFIFLPIFVLFIVFQKQLVGNVSMGGLKE